MAHRWGLCVVLAALLGGCEKEVDPVHHQSGRGGADASAKAGAGAGGGAGTGGNTARHRLPQCAEDKREPLSAWCALPSRLPTYPGPCPDYATLHDHLCGRNDQCQKDPLVCRIRVLENSCGGRTFEFAQGADNGAVTHHYDASGRLIGVKAVHNVHCEREQDSRRGQHDAYGESCDRKADVILDCSPDDADGGTMNDTDAGI